MQHTVQTVICGCCGKEMDVEETLSGYTEDCGLDQKPCYEYQLIRAQECPHCHYCSVRPEEPVTERVKRLVQSEKYQELMAMEGVDAENHRRKAAARLTSDPMEKWRLYLAACWQLEFREKQAEAAAMRKKAVSFMREELEGEPSFELVLMYLDCQRQLGEFGECRETIDGMEAAVREQLSEQELMRQIFFYEKQLTEAGDGQPHRISEVPDR